MFPCVVTPTTCSNYLGAFSWVRRWQLWTGGYVISIKLAHLQDTVEVELLAHPLSDLEAEDDDEEEAASVLPQAEQEQEASYSPESLLKPNFKEPIFEDVEVWFLSSLLAPITRKQTLTSLQEDMLRNSMPGKILPSQLKSAAFSLLTGKHTVCRQRRSCLSSSRRP